MTCVSLFSFLVILVLQDYHQNGRLDQLEIAHDGPLDHWPQLIPYKPKSSLVQIPKEPLMGPMTNQTLRQELGRSAWRILHVYAFFHSMQMTFCLIQE